jgi:hypothetical protein
VRGYAGASQPHDAARHVCEHGIAAGHGYSNDVFGYLPSRRVLLEGGYEGADAMVYYGRPGPFTANVEELIIGQIRRFATSSSARESPGSR